MSYPKSFYMPKLDLLYATIYLEEIDSFDSIYRQHKLRWSVTLRFGRHDKGVFQRFTRPSLHIKACRDIHFHSLK